MPRNGTGTYAAPANSWNPPVSGVTMIAADWAALLGDVVAALSLSIASDGQTTTTQRIPFSQGLSLALGSVAAPGASFLNDTASGLYQPAVGQVGLSAAGVAVLNATNNSIAFPLAATFAQKLTANGDAQVGGAAGKVGFFGSAGAVKPTITGSRASGAAVASILSALVAQGWCIDNSTA